MDWLVSALETTTPIRLPIWLLITQVYWKDILAYRKFGRRLAATLLQHLSEVCAVSLAAIDLSLTWPQNLKHPDADILAPLTSRLEQSLSKLMLYHPENFVAPLTWRKHHSLIESHFAARHDRIVADLERRNARLRRCKNNEDLSVRQNLLRLLDASLKRPCRHDIADTCWQLTSDQSAKTELIETVLDWSSSIYRPELAKTYVGVRLLRAWSSLGVDVTGSVLSFLDMAVCEVGRDRCAFYLLVSELARSGHFCSPRYLRWLVARGGLHSANDLGVGGPCATRLLAELPVDSLSEDMDRLRASILNRACCSLKDENSKTSACMAIMGQRLGSLRGNRGIQLEPHRLGSSEFDESELKHLSRASKSTIGTWLRDGVHSSATSRKASLLDHWDKPYKPCVAPNITKEDFQRLQRYIELTDDYSMFADILKLVATSDDGEILALCADSLNLHLLTFAAVGAVDVVLELLFDRLRSLNESMDFAPKRFLLSLMELCQQIPNRGPVSQELAQELLRCDRCAAVDACSPISDHMAQNAGDVEFMDEIEKALASGTSMDQATMARLFKRILDLSGSFRSKSPEQLMNCIALLSRLRSFDHVHFDDLMVAWIRQKLFQDRPAALVELVAPLLAFACLSFKDIFRAFFDYYRGVMKDAPGIVQNIRHFVSLLLVTPITSQDMSVECRLRIKQAHAIKDHPAEVLSLLCLSFQAAVKEDGASNQGGTCEELIELLSRPHAIRALQTLVLSDAELVCQKLVLPVFTNGLPHQKAALENVIDLMLFPQRPGLEVLPVASVIGLANDLTTPYCQLKLRSAFSSGSSDDTLAGDAKNFKFAGLYEGVDSAISAHNISWLCIIPLLDSSVTEHLCQRVEAQFLGLFPDSDHQLMTKNLSFEDHIIEARTLLHVIEMTTQRMVSTIPSVNNPTATAESGARLHQILSLLSSSQGLDAGAESMRQWLPLLLDFLTIRTVVPPLIKATEEHRAKILSCLTEICLRIWASDTGTNGMSDILGHALDLALHIVDTISDDVRQQQLRRIRERTADPRIRYLYSFAVDPSDWLALNQKDGVLTQTGADSDVKDVSSERRAMAKFPLKRWELLGEPTPNVGDNDTSLSLTLFGARRG